MTQQKTVRPSTARNVQPDATLPHGAVTQVLAGNNEIDRFRTLAFFVGFDVEADALSLDQRFQPRTFNGGNMNEHVAGTVIGFDEAVAAFAVEKLDRTGHCHRSSPVVPRRHPHGAAASADIHAAKELRQKGLQSLRRPPTGGGTPKPAVDN